MDQDIEKFIEKLKKRTDVRGVILFGSHARGDARSDSDVDLLVILDDGFERTVEYEGGRAFEITYTTESAAIDYWKANIDDCANLWSVAKSLHDKDGVVEKLRTAASDILKEGKKPLKSTQKKHYEFDAKDQINAAAHIFKDNPANAEMLLNQKVFELAELYFDISGAFTPPPKNRLSEVQKSNPDLANLLKDFYQQNDFSRKLDIAKSIVNNVFA